LAGEYFKAHAALSSDEQLHPSTIRQWADTLPKASGQGTAKKPTFEQKVKLIAQFPEAGERRWRVLPAMTNGAINWVDRAGFILAVSDSPGNWITESLENSDFFLDVDSSTVSGQMNL
jgi:hypothetical protein